MSADTHVSSNIGWRFERLGNAIDINPARKLVQGKEYPFVPMEALSTESPNPTFLQRRVWDRSSGSRFQNGDVLLARITPSAENGKTALVNLPDSVAFGSTEFIVLSPKTGGIEDSRFLYYTIKYDKIRKQAIQRMIGSTGRQRIPPEALDDILCAVPPVQEQHGIASILSTIDEAIQKTDEIIAKTQQLKKGLMHQLLTIGIGHTNFKETEIGKIPEKWEVSSIGKDFKVGTGGTPSRENPDYYRGEIPWVKTTEVNYGLIEDTQEHITRAALEETSAKLYRAGTLLIAMYGQGVTRGKAAILGVDAAINQACAAVYGADQVRVSFLFYWCQKQYHRLRSLAQGANQSNFNLSLVRSVRIPVPSIAEQDKIVEILQGFDASIKSEFQRKHNLQQLKTGLTQVLLSGKVRVKVN